MDKFLIRMNKKNTKSTTLTSFTTSVQTPSAAALEVCASTSKTPATSSYTITEMSTSNLNINTQNSGESTSADREEEEVPNYEESEPSHVKKKKCYNQKFRDSWRETYDFIINKNGLTWCKICNMKLQGGGFHIKRHARTNSHIKKYNSAKNTPLVKEVFKAGIKPLQDRVRELEMEVVSFLCEENLPFTLADRMTEFLKRAFPDDVVVKNLKLKRKKATQLALQVLAPFAKSIIIKKLQKEKFSLIVDETTDIGCKKSLVVLARFFDSDESTVKDRFATLIEVKDATALSLFNSIKQFLDENEIPYSNVISLGSDNANVMLGNINSLKQKLTEICPGIFVQGCTCHSLHLAASYACKKMPSTIEQFVRDIYTHFAHSTKKNNELRECQIFAQENPTKMLYPSQTRWLSLKAVCSRVLEHWNSLNLYFQRAAIEDELPVAKNILGALQNPIYKMYLQFLEFNLEQITSLNIEFQSEKPKITVLLSKMTALLRFILRCFIKKDIINTISILDINENNPNNYKNLDNIYFGGKVDAILKNPDVINKISNSDLHNFKIRALDFYVEIVHQIKKRFNFKDKHLQFANLFLPKNVISGETLAISEYSFLFPCLNNLDIDKVNNEWQLVSHMYDEENVIDDVGTFWMKVSKLKNEIGTPMFPNLIQVVKCVLALPHSSAAAERVFSQLSLIKNKLRNRLKIETIRDLLSIKQYAAVNKGGMNLPRNKTFYKNVDVDNTEEDTIVD